MLTILASAMKLAGKKTKMRCLAVRHVAIKRLLIGNSGRDPESACERGPPILLAVLLCPATDERQLEESNKVGPLIKIHEGAELGLVVPASHALVAGLYQ